MDGKRRYWTAMSLLILILLVACAESQPKQMNSRLEPFRYTDQSGNPVALESLKGKVWVANFIFTTCTTVCPGLTANMAQLQKEIQSADLGAELVTFSVDPERDTPDVLKSYLGKFDADFASWHALTGYTFEEMQRYAEENFKMAIEWEARSDQVIHGTSFYLVDKTGTVVSYYDGQDPPYGRIIKDIQALSR